MAQTVLITLTTAGSDTGPFDLYSNIDGFLSPFEVSVSKMLLEGGYLSVLVPDGTTVIRVQSTSVICDNYVDLSIQFTTTTSTTTTSTSSTTTTTTTTPPDPPTANLTFTSYSGGLYRFDLSTPIYSTAVTISAASVIGSTGAVCGSMDEIDTLSASFNITAGNTVGFGNGNSPMSCSINSYSRTNTVTVNGIARSNGQTITIGGTLVTVIISSSCENPYAC